AGATPREGALIDALAVYFTNVTRPAAERAIAYSAAMGKAHEKFPKDDEIAVFYALSLLQPAVSLPSDKTYVNQKQAGVILNDVLTRWPRHPGVAHYVIHSFDFPPLAEMALPAARSYAAIAPAVPHAQHMPSHIFTRLGLWKEAAASNRAAEESAKKFAAEQHMDGAWDQQLHAMDYLIYAQLQMGDETAARAVADEVATSKKGSP